MDAKICKSKICKERLKDKLNKSFYLYLFFEDQQMANYRKRVNEQKKILYIQK